MRIGSGKGLIAAPAVPLGARLMAICLRLIHNVHDFLNRLCIVAINKKCYSIHRLDAYVCSCKELLYLFDDTGVH